LAAFPNVFLHLERLLDDGKRLLFEFFKILWIIDFVILIFLLDFWV
jgi:hypothetical protein